LLLDADRINKGNSKWVEGNKVYTRRFKKTGNNPAAGAASSIPTATVTVVRSASPPTTPNNHQALATVNGNPVSNDCSVENRQPVENGVVKPVVVVVDGRVKINLKAANKGEVIGLMETMKGELEQVRLVAQKLEDKEAEVTAVSTVVGAAGDGEGYNRLQYSGNEIGDRRALFRVNSEVGSVSNGVVRPFGQLSVSVGNINNGVGEFVEKEKRTPKANPYYQSSEFLLGKDRLPAESNKRQKSNSGRKQGKESDRIWKRAFKSCNHLLQRLMKHKYGWVFNEPVNVKMLGLHDYHDIIKRPMDLGTVNSRLAQNFYKSPMEFADDVRLTFRNAMTYNPKGQDIIKKNSSVSQHDDEIEVDIDSVDIETLWELDRFVTNYRKNLSKQKRKAELAQKARAEAGDVNQIMNPEKTNPEVPKENKITEEKTLAGRPVDQGERGGDNASSSSSSSSDSGSSSSDSDSDSSSEDGSDAVADFHNGRSPNKATGYKQEALKKHVVKDCVLYLKLGFMI
ncbi:hypothetical protein M8C21_020293, partial [Ambrosia artemisiifolia]